MHNDHASLAEQLEAFRASLYKRLPPNEREQLHPAVEAMRRVLQTSRLLRQGEQAPDFALPNQHGATISLADRLTLGPVVLLFVRGAWCPFCTLTLRAYQAVLPQIQEAGGSLLAITPQPASTCSLMAERDLLAFETLSDHDNLVAKAYGVAFEVAPELRPMHLRLGHDLPTMNGTGNWLVPLPATFVIDSAGRVALGHVAPSNHLRLEPADAVAALNAARAG